MQTIHSFRDRFLPLFLTAITLGLSSSAFAQKISFSPIERKLIEWTDARESVDSIISYLAHNEEKIAWRAAIGLANVQDTLTRSSLIKALREEKRSDIQDAIAFALGNLGISEAASSAIRLSLVDNLSVIKLEALGRTVPVTELPKTMRFLISEVPSRSVIDGLMQIALRNVPLLPALQEEALEDKFEEVMLRLSESSSDETRWKTAYFYGRLNDSALNLQHLEIIQSLLNDQGEPLARMFAASALGRIHNLQAQNILTRAFRGEREWRVRVNILNALTKAVEVDSTLLMAVTSAITSAELENEGSLHVATAAWGVLEDVVTKNKVSPVDTSDLKGWLLSLMPSRELYPLLPNTQRARALPVLAHYGHSEPLHEFVLEMNTLRDRLIREQTLRAIGRYEDTLGFASLLQSLLIAEPSLQLPYLTALGDIWGRAKTTPWLMKELEARKYANLYRRMLIRMPSLNEDPAIVATVLELLKDSSVIINEEFRNEAKTYLAQYLFRYNNPEFEDQLASTISAIKWLGQPTDSIRMGLAAVGKMATENRMKALTDSTTVTLVKLTGREPNYAAKAPARTKIDWDRLENASDTVLISTDKGLMYVKLYKYEAPLTSLNFINLAKTSFYANNVFHRVVPNFVIQSGDRTHTGYGGPGYSIRREVAPLRFSKAGIIGMASSGKDTEGSQWFITHLPTPHLDTRYSVFGEVIGGGEVIDKIQQYDKISNIFQIVY